MKSIFFDSDLTVQTPSGGLTVRTQENKTLQISLENWSVFVLLIKAIKHNTHLKLKLALNSSKFIEQGICLRINEGEVAVIQGGKLKSFSFFPALRAAFLYLIN